jgi:hypothetical protein
MTLRHRKNDRKPPSFFERVARALEAIAESVKDIAQSLRRLVGRRGVTALKLEQIGDDNMVTGTILGFTPGKTAKFQIIPVDANGNADSLVAGTTLKYTSSDPVNAPIAADPADATGLTALVPVAAGIPAGSVVTLQVDASAQADGTLPTTGPVKVATIALAVKALVLNQLA